MTNTNDPADRTQFLSLPPDPPRKERTSPDATIVNAIETAPRTVASTGGDHIWSGPLLTQVAQFNIGHYAKILIHLLGPALAILATATVLNPIIVTQIVVAIIAGIPVYFATKNNYVKAIASGASVLVAGVLAWFGPSWGLGPVSWHDWVAVLIGALTAAGVLVVPNAVKYSYHLTA